MGGQVETWAGLHLFFPTETSCLSLPLGVLALLGTIQTDLVWQI